jgi:hypothetical protein
VPSTIHEVVESLGCRLIDSNAHRVVSTASSGAGRIAPRTNWRLY